MNLEKILKNITGNVKRNIGKAVACIALTSFLLGGAFYAGKKIGSGMEIELNQDFLKPVQQVVERAEEIETKKSTTNVNGEAFFIDSSTGEEVSIKVEDEKTNNPLRGMEVFYEDGEGFEVFTAIYPSQRFLPSIGIFSHNSEHILKTIRSKKGKLIQVIKDDETLKASWKWHSVLWKEVEYIDTLSVDEMQKIKGVNQLVAAIIMRQSEIYMGLPNYVYTGLPGKSQISISDAFSDLVGSAFFPEIKNLKEIKRWDIYEQKFFGGCNRIFYLPSNVPEITGINIEFKKSEIADEKDINAKISWKSYDREEYDFGRGRIKKDLTVFLGKTKKPDLVYEYYLKKGEKILEKGRTLNNFVNMKLRDGKYELELIIEDEVGNRNSVVKEFEVDAEKVEQAEIRQRLYQEEPKIKSYIEIPSDWISISRGKIKLINGAKNPALVIYLDYEADNISNIIDIYDKKADMCLTKEGKWKQKSEEDSIIGKIIEELPRTVKEIVYIFTDKEFRKKNRFLSIKDTGQYSSEYLQYNDCVIDGKKIDGLYVSAIEVTREVRDRRSTVENIQEAEWLYKR